MWRKILISILTILCLGSIFFQFKRKEKKIAYIELGKVFSDFKMKQELENRLTHIRSSRQNFLDSLELDLRILSRQMQSEKSPSKVEMEQFQFKKNEYLYRKDEFKKDIDSLTAAYDGQIMTQLNQYVKDFGESKGLDFILGTDGAGSIMYANKDYNLTEEVKAFINDRYSGK